MKRKIASLGILAAVLSMGGAPSTQRKIEGIDKVHGIVRQKKPTALNPSVINELPNESGLRPKEYGQMLQAIGKQKWSKRKR